LRKNFDFIVIDGPSYLNEITLEALESADAVVVITDLSVTSVKNTRLLLAVMAVLKIDERRIQLIDNHHRGEVGGLDKAAAESHLKQEIVLQIPYDSAGMEASISRGVPLLLASPNSAASDAIRGLAKHLVPTISTASGSPQVPDPSQLKKKQRRILGFAKS
jgi:pilus assembly protein CpaE